MVMAMAKDLTMFVGSRIALPFILFLLLGCHAATIPNAFSLTPSTTWYGDDGSWSAVSIRVGSPQQWVDVLVSTAASETWAVSPGGCDSSSICKSKRGGFFDSNKSSTWQHEGHFALGLDTRLGFTGDAIYGLDVLEFGTTNVSLKNAIVGSINTTEYWLGILGLGNIAGNFTNIEVTSPISGLARDGSIPSQSYGFTAGAKYQQKGCPVSLTLGGYDANRFIPHNISFELDPGKQPQAFLNSISVASNSPAGKVQNWSSNPLQLLAPENGVYVTIDSSTPFLWLPKSTCERFAQALGLTYNDSLALYTFDGNASKHDELRSWNLNFIFSLSDTSTPSQIVNVTLPYAAFDLQLSYPYIPNTTYADPNKYYFPLRQAANETQYVLGRAFLQEAYLITDYERNSFSVHQAVHNADPLGNVSIINIQRPDNSTNPIMPSQPLQVTTSGGLNKSAIIGITIGAAVLVILLGLFIFYYRRRNHQHAILVENSPEKPSNTPVTPTYNNNSPYATSYGTSPLSPDNNPVFEAGSTRLATSVGPQEVSADASHQIFELPERPNWPEELDSRSISSSRAGREREAGEKFAQQIHWGRENNSGSKCRPSMRLKHDTGAGAAGVCSHETPDAKVQV